MSTHTVPKDTDPLAIDLLEILEDGLGELGRDVAVHLIPLVPRRLGSIEIEAGAGAEIICIILALEF